MTLELRSGAATDVGRVRLINEDSLLRLERLVAVADGMGGHRGGEVASVRALAALRDGWNSPDLESLVAAVRGANTVVVEEARADPNLRGMGTTLCAVGIVGTGSDERLGVVNVGDSRVYLFSRGALVQLTEDHSLVETMVRQGTLTPEEAENHPQRNFVTRALGMEGGVEVDAWELRPLDGDRLLLCSDGLFNEVPPDDIAAMLATHADPEGCASELVDEAVRRGGRDNVTCVVLDVSSAPDTGTDAGTHGDANSHTGGEAAAELDGRWERRFGAEEPFIPPSVTRQRAGKAASPTPVQSGSAPEAPTAESGGAASTTPANVAGATPGGATPGAATPGAAGPAHGLLPPGADESGAGVSDRRGRGSVLRAVILPVAVVGVLAASAVAVLVYGHSGYQVRSIDNGVAVFKGRDLLWFHPERVRTQSVKVSLLTEADRASLTEGVAVGNLNEADRYIARLLSMATTTTTPTPTTTTATTTTLSAAATTALPKPTIPSTPQPTTPQPTTTRPGAPVAGPSTAPAGT